MREEHEDKKVPWYRREDPVDMGFGIMVAGFGVLLACAGIALVVAAALGK